MAETFGVRLKERVGELGPLCVGIDPSRELLDAWGRPDDVEGLEFFALSVLEATLGVAAVIKPQVAFFERMGSGGFRVLERLLSDARDADVMVIADAKRGDFSLSNVGYAEAWLHDDAPLAADALTVSPYLGVDALAPLVDAARASGRGIFVLSATSNPEGRVIQEARTHGVRVQEAVLARVRELNADDDGLGSVGVVLGATREGPDFDLSTLGGPYLVPGVGAQGAGPGDVARLFERRVNDSIVVNVGRAILRAGPDARGLRDAARRWRDDLREVL